MSWWTGRASDEGWWNTALVARPFHPGVRQRVEPARRHTRWSLRGPELDRWSDARHRIPGATTSRWRRERARLPATPWELSLSQGSQWRSPRREAPLARGKPVQPRWEWDQRRFGPQRARRTGRRWRSVGRSTRGWPGRRCRQPRQRWYRGRTRMLESSRRSLRAA